MPVLPMGYVFGLQKTSPHLLTLHQTGFLTLTYTRRNDFHGSCPPGLHYNLSFLCSKMASFWAAGESQGITQLFVHSQKVMAHPGVQALCLALRPTEQNPSDPTAYESARPS
jgi:hypothetical protein